MPLAMRPVSSARYRLRGGWPKTPQALSRTPTRSLCEVLRLAPSMSNAVAGTKTRLAQRKHVTCVRLLRPYPSFLAVVFYPDS